MVGGGGDEPHDPKLPLGWYKVPLGWYKGRLPWNVGLGRPICEAWALRSGIEPAPGGGKLVDADAAWG